jgi:Ca2+-transporting ATPase
MITAVEQGRTIYNNIRKSLRFLLATNLSEIEVMLITTALGLGEALNPMQLLWINLVTDIFPALALAMEPPERDVLKQAPRDPRDPIIGRKDTLRLLRESSVITAGTIGVYAYSVARYGAGMRASTNTFMTLTVAQFLQSISCRSETTTILDRSRPGNRYLGMAIAGSLGLQALTVLLPPLRALLRLSPVTLVDLLMIMAGSGAPFFINETTKTLRLTRSQEPKLP